MSIFIQPPLFEIKNPGNLALEEEERLTTIFDEYDCRNIPPSVLLIRNDIMVRTTTPKDWNYINYLMKNNSNKIGFLPKRTWEAIWGGIKNSLCWICFVNNQPAGYIYLTPGKLHHPVRVQQIVIQEDARRWEYGTALVDVTELFRRKYHRSGIILRCRSDLEANIFWKVLGFNLIGTQKKGTINHNGWKASLDINIYERINANRLFE